ncbi:MAG: transaldolase, partial [Ignavibacteria bacterium]|nr:transaldolase [Ignavibacteria bacterium]
PTLMKKDGVTDYVSFAKDVLTVIKDMPISFEVFSDDFDSMEKQARLIGSWGENVYIKIPVTNTKGETSYELIKKLTSDGLKLNITAIMTTEQVEKVMDSISENTKTIISVFAGRIADTGRDPIPYMKRSLEIVKKNSNAELLWASSRELLNIIQADECGCDIVTVTNDIIKKLIMINKDLDELSLDTVKMFYNDAASAGYSF